MRTLVVALCLGILVLLVDLFRGPGSPAEVAELRDSVERMRSVTEELRSRNEVLNSEIVALTGDLDAVEELARQELGMIREEETFYLLRDDANAAP